jgi:uncharacterized OsmC-like protein
VILDDSLKISGLVADYKFRARSTWVSNTQNPTIIQPFYGVEQQDDCRAEPSVCDANHPAALIRTNQAPTPAEFLFHAIAACITAGLADIAAAARNITLHPVESTVEGDIDLLGTLGLDSNVRTGWRKIRVSFTVDGNATPEQLGALVEQSRRRSSVPVTSVNGRRVGSSPTGR